MIWVIGIASFAVSALLCVLVIAIAKRYKILDIPRDDSKKVHKKTTPLMGGTAIYIAIAALVGVLLLRSDLLTSGEVGYMHYIGLLAGGLVLIIGGILDDKYDLSPKVQILFPIIAALCAIAGGIGIEKMTNPFGGVVFLEHSAWGSFDWPGDVLVFLWMIGMMYTTKLLDGLDGLTTSVGSAGALIVLLLAGSVAYFQPDVVVLSAVILGAFLGFLVWNVHPAKVFLGEGGALLVGYLLGALAVISGGKIATLLLVMGIPILDVVWVIGRRMTAKKKVSKGDRLHLHHRLFDSGMSQRQVVLLYTVLAVGFGVLTLVLSSFAKLIALTVLALIMLISAYFLVFFGKKNVKGTK